MQFKKRYFFLLVLLLQICNLFQASAQVQLYKKDDKFLIALPVVSYAQETSLSFGVSSLFSLKLDSSASTRQSNIALGITYSILNQKNLLLYSNTWSKDNKVHLVNDFYFSDFPYNFYGIGNETEAANLNKIKDRNIKLAVDLEFKQGKRWYIGPNNYFYRNSITDLDSNGVYNNETFDGKTLSMLNLTGISVIYDSRDVINYASSGHYVKLTAAYSPKYGQDFYNIARVQFQTRSFISLKKNDPKFKHVFALHSVHNFLLGKDLPFSQLSIIGGSNIMRGYYAGRFRDRNSSALQLEHRYHFIKKWTLATFIGAGGVYQQLDEIVANLKPNYGLGIRFFADVDSRLTLRIDYGFGEKRRNEDRLSGLIIGVTEAF